MSLAIGSNVGRYEIRSLLGEGGMGQVYLAFDPSLRRRVAVKLLSGSELKQGQLLRFEQEAYAVSALNHPNILTIYEIGTTGGSPFIATEFIDGVTLRQHLRCTQIELREALNVAIQVGSALAAAHGAHHKFARTVWQYPVSSKKSSTRPWRSPRRDPPGNRVCLDTNAGLGFLATSQRSC